MFLFWHCLALPAFCTCKGFSWLVLPGWRASGVRCLLCLSARVAPYSLGCPPLQASPTQQQRRDADGTVQVHAVHSAAADDDDDTPMPVSITADEANLFQVRWGGMPPLCKRRAPDCGAMPASAPP